MASSECAKCAERPALVCAECMRALALIDQPAGFDGIARHPETGTDCRICGRGGSAYCPECFCEQTLSHRAHLLQHGWARATLSDLDEQAAAGRRSR